jgi:hypothetical protein
MKMGTVERGYLPPLNPRTAITEADRARVYDIIRSQLADILSGEQSYYPDGVQKDMQQRTEDLERFIGSVKSLQGVVDDPSNMLGSVADDLGRFAKVVAARNAANEPSDPIVMPKEFSPGTMDRNELYVDPEPRRISPPGPLDPSQRPTFRKVSVQGTRGAADRPELRIPPPIFFPLN